MKRVDVGRAIRQAHYIRTTGRCYDDLRGNGRRKPVFRRPYILVLRVARQIVASGQIVVFDGAHAALQLGLQAASQVSPDVAAPSANGVLHPPGGIAIRRVCWRACLSV